MSAVPPAVQKQPSSPDDPEFSSEFERGMAAEEARAFERARVHYERALARAEKLAEPLARLRSLLALGWVHNSLKRYLRSVEYLKRALADPALPKGPAKEARTLIDDNMKWLGELRIDIHPSSGAVVKIAVTVDSREIGPASEVAVEPGTHEVRARAPGYREFIRYAEVAAGQSIDVKAILAREEPTSAMRRAAWIVGGVAALALVVGVSAGAYSWAKHGESDCRSGVNCTSAEVEHREAAITAGNVSTAAWVVAGVGAGASALLFWRSGTSSESDTAASTRVDVGIANVRISHAW